MKSTSIIPNKNFIGRKAEQEKLRKIASSGEASILIMYGRRRVGKTELLEQTFRDRNLLKFEGIEGVSQTDQYQNILNQLARYAEEPLIAKVTVSSWREVFELIAKYVKKGVWTLYFEEVQWLADYRDNFISELKYVWDNFLRHNSKLLLILCGSSPSFMLGSVIKSKALYNRSEYEMPLKEFTLPETHKFLGAKRSQREVMDAYLTLGGIPEYLKRINRESSVYLGICKNAFTSGSFFAREYEKIFVSHLGHSKNYRKIIDYLSKVRFATREEILKQLKTESGGTITALLDDLEICGFITKYHPFGANDGSLLTRYHIQDAYLQFYYKFIKHLNKDITHGDYERAPQTALKTETYNKWLGFSFERWCRKNHRLISQILGFESVIYQHGAYFSRASMKQDSDYQLDLVFDRDDKVYTICEIKYLQAPVGKGVIKELERKLELFSNPKKRTIHKILITAEGADRSVVNAGYFDRIITLKELFEARYW